ncbi:MAG: glycosyltransferase [Sphingomonadaceae bacterium]
MRVVGISSWEPRACGIATYFKEQSDALARLGHQFQIVTHTDEGLHRDQPGVFGLIDVRDPHWYRPVHHLIANNLRPDLVHIQHEFGLYSAPTANGEVDADGLLALLGLLRMEGIPVVVTTHTLCGTMKPHEAEHYRAMIPLSTITVAHAPYQVERLKDNLGAIPRNVTYVEHGATPHTPEDVEAMRLEGKHRFGLEGQQVVGLNGWWSANKNFVPIIRAWGTEIYPRLRNRNTVLAVMGAPRAGDDSQLAYKEEMMRAVEESPARETIRVVEKSFPPEEFELSLAAIDLAVLPYVSASQSGVAAHTGAVGTAMVLRDLEGLGAYARAAGQALMPFTGNAAADLAAAADTIVAIMNDPARLRRMQSDVCAYTREVISWDRVAERYDRIYRAAVAVSRQIHDLEHSYSRAAVPSIDMIVAA